MTIMNNRGDQEVKEQESRSKLTSNEPGRIWKKPRALLFVGLCAGLICLSSCSQKKGVEFSQISGQENVMEISNSTNNTSEFSRYLNRVNPILKWNLDKKWEWKPFTAGKYKTVLRKLKDEEKRSHEELTTHKKIHSYIDMRKFLATEIAISVEAHLLPDPRISKEALDDFCKVWGLFSEELKEDVPYFTSISTHFDKDQIQVLQNARNFFSDKRKMEKVRKNIEGAESSKDLFKKGTEEAALHREFLRHLTNIDEMILFKVTKEEHSDTK